MIKVEDKNILPPFSGKRDLLILGTGAVELVKAIDGVNFYPITDGSSGSMIAEGSDVIFNGTVENLRTGVRLALVSDDEFTWSMS